jgi:hypothetical protein
MPRHTPPREEIRPPEDEWVDVGTDVDAEPWRGPVFSPRDPRMERGRPGDLGDAWRLDPSMLPAGVRVISLFGCLRRLVMIALILLVLLAIGFFGLFGGFVFGSEPAQRHHDAAGGGVSAVPSATRLPAPLPRRTVHRAP